MPDSQYPYKCFPLEEMELSAKKETFNKINIYEGLSLDNYGFIWGEIEFRDGELNTLNDFYTKLDTTINRYYQFMGIEAPSVINIETDLNVVTFGYQGPNYKHPLLSDYYGLIINDDRYLRVELPQKLPKTSKVSIFIQVTFKENRIHFSGNWYPEIFVPKSQIYSKEEAIEIASNYTKNKIGERFNDSDSNLEINKIFIRNMIVGGGFVFYECWNIYVKDRGLEFNIDTQTGEVHSV